MKLAELLRQRRDAAVHAAEEMVARWGDHRDGSTAQQMELEQRLSDASLYGRLLADVVDDIRQAGGPYGPGSRFSFYRDLLDEDPDSRVRLNAHRERVSQVLGTEERAAGSADLGALVPPGTALEAAAGVPRASRALLDAILADGGEYPLPAEGTAMIVPCAATSGVTASSQSAENTSVSASTPIYVDAQVPVVTIAARVDISRQVFDRNPVAADAHITATLLDALGAEQERQLVAGTGAGGQMTGLLNAGTTWVACTTAEGRVVTQKTAQAARLGAEYRLQVPTIVAMTPTRWLWLGAEATTTQNDAVDFGRRRMLGVDVVQAAGIPSTVSGDQDRIITLRGSDVAYAEGPPMVRRGPGQGAASGTVPFLAIRYVAMAVRYPNAVASVSGSGLVQPSAF